MKKYIIMYIKGLGDCYICTKCNTIFVSKNDIIAHIKYHEEIEPELIKKQISKELYMAKHRKQKKITQYQ